MKTGLTISTVGHLAVAVLGLLMMWGVVSFSKPMIEMQSVPVGSITEAELTQIMQGVKSAQKRETPRPLVEKVAPEIKAPKNEAQKIDEKHEVTPTATEQAQPPQVKPEQKTEQKTTAESKPEQATPPRDEIAEALKREEQKKKEDARKAEEAKKKEEAKKRLEAKKREQEQKYNTDTIESRLAMLDKRTPTRNAATGATINQTASLGTATGTAMTLSVNEIDALRRRLAECWDVPVGVRDAKDLVVTVHIEFKKDGSLAQDPVVTNRSMVPVFQVAAESALRAVRKCAPFNFLPPAKYEAWSDVTVDFNPREMFGG